MKGSILKKLAFLLYLLLVIFGGSEILFRIFDPLKIHHFFEMKSVLNTMQHNDIYEYTQQPGLQKTFKHFNLKINSQGFRWLDFPVKKDSTKKRILLIGDSMVLGWGVPFSEIFPSRLQQYSDSLNKHWEVLAAGAISWNTRNEVEYLKSEGIKYDPDLIVLVVFANDVLPKVYSKTTVPKAELFPNLAKITNPPVWRKIVFGAARAIVYRSYVLTSILYLSAWQGQNDDFYEHYSGDTPAWRDVAFAWAELDHFCKQRQKQLAVVLATYEDQSTKSSKIYVERYRSKLAELNIPLAEIVMAYHTSELRNSQMDGHPNGKGHKLISREMIPFIEKYINSD